METKSRGYKTFDHTADVGLEIWGDSFEAIFEEAGKALFSLMVDLTQVMPKESVYIELKGESGEELFLAWMKELLYLFDTSHILLSRFEVGAGLSATRLADPSSGGKPAPTYYTLKVKASGELLDNTKHHLGREVKAVTRHQYEFKKTEAGFRAKVIIDI